MAARLVPVAVPGSDRVCRPVGRLVVDPAGLMLTLRLDRVAPDRVEGVVVGTREHNPEPVARIVIAIAHLPAPALELVLSRCTEAGAFAFYVVQADRSVAASHIARFRHIVASEAWRERYESKR